jgi:hypothetical protein
MQNFGAETDSLYMAVAEGTLTICIVGGGHSVASSLMKICGKTGWPTTDCIPKDATGGTDIMALYIMVQVVLNTSRWMPCIKN